MTVEVVIAHRSDHGPRDRNLSRVLDHYAGWRPQADHHIGMHPPVISIHDTPGAVFSRAAAFNRAVDASHADTLVLSNSDVLCPYDQLDQAVTLAQAGTTVYPFTRYLELTKACTIHYLNGTTTWLDTQLEMGIECVGPLLVIERSAYLFAGGMDQRFLAWGQEDIAWQITSETLLGASLRVAGHLLHLWHPFHPSSRRGGGEKHKVFKANQALCDLYRAAAGDPEALAKVRG